MRTILSVAFFRENLKNIRQNKTQRLEEAYRFIDLTLFDAFIGNHDRHGRNIGIIESSKGYRLSPFYDNPCYLGIEEDFLLGANHEPRGKIATQATLNPTMTDYIDEWKRLGLDSQVLDFYKRINLEEVINTIDAAYISDKRKNAIKKVVLNRYKEFKHACL